MVARQAPEDFRRILNLAQEHFIYDKPVDHLSTTEDDVRFLPDVPDADLERFFLDDFRGRQLLHVSARSISTALWTEIEEWVESLPGLREQIAATVTKHAEALQPVPTA